MKAWELLDSPEKWCKGTFAKNSSGDHVEIYGEAACQWCVSGAIHKCYEDQPFTISVMLKKLQDRAGVRVGAFPGPWNDAPERTWEEVHSLLKELDI